MSVQVTFTSDSHAYTLLDEEFEVAATRMTCLLGGQSNTTMGGR